MGQIIQEVEIDVLNYEPFKSLIIVLGQEYDNLPDAVKRALDPLLEDEKGDAE